MSAGMMPVTLHYYGEKRMDSLMKAPPGSTGNDDSGVEIDSMLDDGEQLYDLYFKYESFYKAYCGYNYSKPEELPCPEYHIMDREEFAEWIEPLSELSQQRKITKWTMGFQAYHGLDEDDIGMAALDKLEEE